MLLERPCGCCYPGKDPIPWPRKKGVFQGMPLTITLGEKMAQALIF